MARGHSNHPEHAVYVVGERKDSKVKTQENDEWEVINTFIVRVPQEVSLYYFA